MPNRHLILYAEDDLDDLLFVRAAFEQHDHIELVHAADGVETLNLLKELSEKGNIPCLIILDINMPRMDGRQALEEIRKKESWKKIPIILFSTSSSPRDHEFARNWGSELITKPLNIHDLEHVAVRFLDTCNFEINKIKG